MDHRPRSQPPVPGNSNMALELIFDFDGTITEADSIASVVDAALSHHKALSPTETFASLTDAWHHIVRSYLAELDSYHGILDSTVLGHHHPSSLQVAKAQFSNGQRRRIEQASLLRVQDAGLFRGVPLQHLYRCGQEHVEKQIIKLRNGFSELIDLARGPSSMHSTKVLSVNWSATYIRGVLTRVGTLPVFANETNPVDGSIMAVPAASADIAAAAWPSVLTVGSDKLSALRCLRRQHHGASTNIPPEIVYFGDSTTDLECLLEFGGIVISPRAETVQPPGNMTSDPSSKAVMGSDLLHVLQTTFRYSVPHVSQYKDELVCWARDFAEVVHSNFLQKRAANVRA
ncbi:hypothetical protein KVR01_010998 [Diaporthe batatas]|uniref:uncharacterized protein n=1 Tax=Diaporthe batatas TaxID=748121 RepID=UPI001D0471C9|nr:uncharacterized protein KVR01_010998 [Diaporthe batatas]KAG8159337.1 hypothetical protein KVR01_010998 [Diaporthe batatas]